LQLNASYAAMIFYLSLKAKPGAELRQTVFYKPSHKRWASALAARKLPIRRDDRVSQNDSDGFE
jgi:hypothetical protein